MSWSVNPLRWFAGKKAASAPEPKLPRPSSVQLVNYIRAAMILRNIPFKKLGDELKKVPWFTVVYITGVVVWVYMTYSLCIYLFRAIFI
jgi:hypothetical protein